MTSADKIAGGTFFLLGVGAVIGAVRLEIGSPSVPQAGFFPFLAGLALMGLSALLLVQDLRGRSTGGEDFGHVRPVLLAIAGLIAFVLLLDPLGYVFATSILAVALLYVLDVRKIWVFVLMVPIVSLGSFALFHWLLSVPLPTGPLASTLGF